MELTDRAKQNGDEPLFEWYEPAPPMKSACLVTPENIRRVADHFLSSGMFDVNISIDGSDHTGSLRLERRDTGYSITVHTGEWLVRHEGGGYEACLRSWDQEWRKAWPRPYDELEKTAVLSGG